MDKFDKMKEEITESGKKFKEYQEEIETRKIKIDLLEA
jgi:peptidoglycan hydrolase CwlO-like protein